MIVVTKRRGHRGAVVALGLAWLVAFAPGCRARGESVKPDEAPWQRDVMALEAAVALDPDNVQAWRDLGHIRWIHLGQSKVAKEIFEANAQARGDLASRLALLVMADARLEIAAVVEHAYAAIVQAALVPAGDPNEAFANRVAEYAARRIGATHGDLPGDDARFVAMYDALEADIDAG
ncbi:MAG: hypothetical protein JKY37_30305, partial [Nannocystaceae bacterium]|nr:hypothetical protein [Nannocystaceae bacterium]